MVEDPVIELDDDTFEQVIKEGVVLVDYFAEWCAPCRSLAPILQEIAIELQDSMKFAKLNIDTSHKATKTSQITSVPTLILFPVVITSFGYHIIIPSLVTYMNHDRKKLFWVICIGSFFPLMFYIIWQILILGIVPMQGEKGLVEAWCRGLSATYPLTHIITNIWANIGAQFFSFFAITTSFLGVTLSLSDFLIDGLKIKKSWEGRLIACILTFVPPLIFVFTYQRGFLVALEYAGVFVSILLVFLPAMMVWKLKTIPLYSTILGKMIIITVLLFAACIVVVDILEQWGCLKPLISSYFR